MKAPTWKKVWRLGILDRDHLIVITGKPDPQLTMDNGRTDMNTDRKLERDTESPYASYCRADAPIWGRYLKETEMEDKEVTDLWNSSLDSLLVFVSGGTLSRVEYHLKSNRLDCLPLF